MGSYTKINLRELENMSPKHGHDKYMEARFATKPLGLTKSGLGMQKVLPNRTVPFKHRHGEQEEIFICISGNGYMVLNEQKIPITQWDAVRVAPELIRTMEAGADGLEVIIVGAPYLERSDVEMIRD
jgi:quercetin dioxygenase-like cupin family protein